MKRLFIAAFLLFSAAIILALSLETPKSLESASNKASVIEEIDTEAFPTPIQYLLWETTNRVRTVIK